MITERQKELLSLIYQYIKDTGYPPTFEEMRERLGVSSNQSVIDLLKKLENNKMIQKGESVARSIAILPLGYEALGRPPLVAFLGVTSAGSPIEAIGISGEWLPLVSRRANVDDKVERLKDDVFILKISGDSMINAGIEDGDVVLVQAQKEFVSGDIVLARIGEDATIKRFISIDKPPYTYLKPENPKYNIILFTDDVRLTGKVISVLKNNYWKPLK
jgi:repressor LexA